MFRRYFSFLLLVAACFPAGAQLSVTSSDMPRPDSVLWYSEANLPFLVNPGTAGDNKNWNFTGLTRQSQYSEEFTAVSNTNPVYLLMFGVPFFDSYSNLAKKEANMPSLPPQAGLEFGNGYNFYHNVAGRFSQKGFGATLNGFPVPVVYDAPDVLYAFPLMFGNKDTSRYRYEVSIPGLGYYGRKAVRINEVDGRGTLRTPYGTVEALRIRSVVEAVDSIALDTLGLGISLPLPPEVRYKWVAPGHGWPLLEMTATELFGFEVVSRVVYRDHPPPDVSIQAPGTVSSVKLYPNPAREWLVVEMESKKAIPVDYTLLDATGKIVYSTHRAGLPAGSVLELIPLASLNLSAGTYFVRIQAGNASPVIKPVVVNNP